MRTWGRVNGQWTLVQTAPNGDNSAVYITALYQCLKLNINESPMFGTWGIPGRPAVQQQQPPDYYAQLNQQRWAPFFASLIIYRVANSNPPTYQANILTKLGAVLTGNPVPT